MFVFNLFLQLKRLSEQFTYQLMYPAFMLIMNQLFTYSTFNFRVGVCEKSKATLQQALHKRKGKWGGERNTRTLRAQVPNVVGFLDWMEYVGAGNLGNAKTDEAYLAGGLTNGACAFFFSIVSSLVKELLDDTWQSHKYSSCTLGRAGYQTVLTHWESVLHIFLQSCFFFLFLFTLPTA